MILLFGAAVAYFLIRRRHKNTDEYNVVLWSMIVVIVAVCAPVFSFFLWSAYPFAVVVSFYGITILMSFIALQRIKSHENIFSLFCLTFFARISSVLFMACMGYLIWESFFEIYDYYHYGYSSWWMDKFAYLYIASIVGFTFALLSSCVCLCQVTQASHNEAKISGAQINNIQSQLDTSTNTMVMENMNKSSLTVSKTTPESKLVATPLLSSTVTEREMDEIDQSNTITSTLTESQVHIKNELLTEDDTDLMFKNKCGAHDIESQSTFYRYSQRKFTCGWCMYIEFI